jgi:hypothetical protein
MLGDKYELAKQVNIKLVNHRWLEEWYMHLRLNQPTPKNSCCAVFFLICAELLKYCICYLLQLKGMGNPSD